MHTLFRIGILQRDCDLPLSPFPSPPPPPSKGKVRRNSNIRRSVQLSVFREDPSNRKSIRAPVNFRNACADFASSADTRSLVQQSCELTRCICRNTPIDELDKKRRKRSGIISNWFVRLTVQNLLWRIEFRW